jgi:hypothetical protein
VSSAPRATSRALAKDAIELSGEAGLLLDEWQQLVLTGGTGQSRSRWAATRVGCWVPRQNGKGGIIEARVLAGLVLLKEPLIVWSAHQFSTAQEGFRRIRDLIALTPDLNRMVIEGRGGYKTGALGMGIEFKNGQRLRFLARSRSSGRGFTGDCLILDEAQELTSEQMAAILPTKSARPDAQVWMFGTPPTNPEAWCYGLREDGEAGKDRLAWYDWGAASGLQEESWDDRDLWYATNPALGIRIDEETVEDEFGPSGLGAEFPHERLGLWRPKAGATDQVIDPAAWSACEDRQSTTGAEVALCIDVTPRRDHASIGLYSLRPDGLGHIELIDYRSGVRWVVPALKKLIELHNPIAVGLDGNGPAAALLPDLTEAGIVAPEDPERPERGQLAIPSAGERAGAYGQMIDAVVERELRHRNQPLLNLAVSGAKTRTLGDLEMWTRRKAAVDITPLVAVTLARWAFVSRYDLVAGTSYDLMQSFG